MIAIWMLFLIAGVIAFFATYKLAMPVRIGIGLAVFLIPSVAVAWLIERVVVDM